MRRVEVIFGSILTNKNTLRKEIEIWLQMGFRFWGWCPPTIFLGLWRTTGWVVVVMVVVVGVIIIVVGQVVLISLTHTNYRFLCPSINTSELHPMSILHVDDRFDKFLAIPLSLRDKTHNSPTTNILVKWVPTLLEMEISSGQELPRPKYLLKLCLLDSWPIPTPHETMSFPKKKKKKNTISVCYL